MAKKKTYIVRGKYRWTGKLTTDWEYDQKCQGCNGAIFCGKAHVLTAGGQRFCLVDCVREA